MQKAIQINREQQELGNEYMNQGIPKGAQLADQNQQKAWMQNSSYTPKQEDFGQG